MSYAETVERLKKIRNGPCDGVTEVTKDASGTSGTPSGEAFPNFHAALHKAVAGTSWNAESLQRALSDDDLADLQAGNLDADTLRAFMHAVKTRQTIEAGKVPEHFTEIAHCKHCGPIWLWIEAEVEGCPWCRNRRDGLPIPQPEQEHDRD